MNKSSNLLAVALTALVCALAVTTAHAQSAASPLQFERGFPTAGTAEKANDASDLRRAIEEISAGPEGRPMAERAFIAHPF